MTRAEQNELVQTIERVLDRRFSTFEKKIKEENRAYLDERFGKNDKKIEEQIENRSGSMIGIALERLDDNFQLIKENFQTVNARFDRLITILEDKEVVEEGYFN